MPSRWLLLFLILPLPACYLGVRAGPSWQRTADGSFREKGVDVDVTLGMEVYLDRPAVFNPLAGKTRVAVGSTFVSSTNDGVDGEMGTARSLGDRDGGPAELSAAGAVFNLEFSRTLYQTVWSGSEDDPRSGAIVRATATTGYGGGAVDLVPAMYADPLHGEAKLWTASAGFEAGLHGGGSRSGSGGIFIGTGVRWAYFDSDVTGDVESVSPYISFQLEGVALLEGLGHGLRGALRCR